jgi:hypothetical protein
MGPGVIAEVGVLMVACVLFMGMASMASASETPVIPIGLDSYRMWDRWPVQRIGARAYMRSTYDRAGGNETADASHFLYQEAEDFNVTLDVEGRGVLYFVRTNHWHGSPWHYEVDGTDHIVQETTTADPTKKLEHSVFIPEELFPNPLTWTYAITKGADLMWVPMPFEERFRLAYARTFYGTGYYIYHLYPRGVNLSQPLRAWDGATPPDEDVLDLLRAAGTDIAPKLSTPEGKALGLAECMGTVTLPETGAVELTHFDDGPRSVRALSFSVPRSVRALSFSVPREQAVAFGRGRLRVTWDNRNHASIDAPLDLFFGTGTLHNREDKEYLVKALPVNVRFDAERVHLACYFPMPFFRSARFELVGNGEEAIEGVHWTVRTQTLSDPANHTSYFHATYRDHPDPVPGKDNVFLDTREVEGGGDWSGSFVGTSFIFSDQAVLTTLEGDPRFFFDDSQSPQAYGTGTEEWGGGGDYWGGLNMTLPLAGHPVGVRRAADAEHPEDLIQSAYRFLLADLMPFGKRAVIGFEHGGENESEEHYQSVTYWYGLPAASLVLTDELDVGDAASERAHGYASPDASDPYTLTSRYELGPDELLPGKLERFVVAAPKDYADFVFVAAADTTYKIWLRGMSHKGVRSDAVWLQFDDDIGSERLKPEHADTPGFGNWRETAGAGDWIWSSRVPGGPPATVRFERAGRHRLRIHVRHGAHFIDQIWLSATQTEQPTDNEPVDGSLDGNSEIVLEATDVVAMGGSFEKVEVDGASGGRALLVPSHIPGLDEVIQVYPAHEETGRKTTTASEFTLKVSPNNLGVLLRRTLDYQYPNQRARVYVADVGGASDWKEAGVWYLAGSNTCYHSYPREAGELGASEPVVQTSNRRFRDDEFLIPRDLTEGRKAIRVRVEFTPVSIPLLLGRDVGEKAWSEIRYKAYSWVLPEFSI